MNVSCTDFDSDGTKAEMQRFTEMIINMMKSNKLFEPQGGPIIMSQVFFIYLFFDLNIVI